MATIGQLGVALLATFVGLFLISLGIHLGKFYLKRITIKKLTRNMSSGIFIEHGVVIDQETGLARPQHKPSRQAYTYLR